MRIIWHGHSCFELDDGNVTVVLDPHDGKSLGIRPPSASANAILVTHGLHDHSASKAIRGNHMTISERPGKFSFLGINAEGFLECAEPQGSKITYPNVVYRLTMDGISICHCGDLCSFPSDKTLKGIRNVDILLVPVGEVNTLDLDSVFRLIDEVSPKVVVPMHYHVCGLSLPLKGLDRFLERIDAPINYVGNEMDISKDEFLPSREFWIFTR